MWNVNSHHYGWSGNRVKFTIWMNNDFKSFYVFHLKVECKQQIDILIWKKKLNPRIFIVLVSTGWSINNKSVESKLKRMSVSRSKSINLINLLLFKTWCNRVFKNRSKQNTTTTRKTTNFSWLIQTSIFLCQQFSTNRIYMLKCLF